jgi:hypothetical protein
MEEEVENAEIVFMIMEETVVREGMPPSDWVIIGVTVSTPENAVPTPLVKVNKPLFDMELYRDIERAVRATLKRHGTKFELSLDESKAGIRRLHAPGRHPS